MPIEWSVLLRQVWAQLLKHWQTVLIVFAVALVGAYIHNAEDAKKELAETRRRAVVADSLRKVHEAESLVLGHSADSLRQQVSAVDAKWQRVVRDLRTQLGHVPKPDTVVLGSGNSVDTTGQTLISSGSSCPSIELLIAACNARVAVRDSLITTLDKRHHTDSLTILDLTHLVPGAVLIPPKPPSRLRRALEGAAFAAAGAVVGQQVSGRKGLILGTSLGTLLGLLR